MKNVILNTNCGDTFMDVSKKAKEMSIERNNNVEFDFNGINCIISATTNLEWLYRDYCNAWVMKWEKVGPDCVSEYDAVTLADLAKKVSEQDAKDLQQRKEYEAKEQKERKTFNEKTRHVNMEFKSLVDWDEGKAKNTDDYGSCIYEYAEGWAKLMQIEIENGKQIEDIAEKTSHELGFLGITGYMYGAAVSVLSNCWLHGEKLRKWHNKEYKHEGNGVVNPALLTIKA